MNLFEAYKKRLAIAEKVYAAKHPGETMDTHRKLVVATCLKNVNAALNEAFTAGAATQSVGATSLSGTTTLGDYKKFSLNLVNVALPNLIANDLVIVHPMTSFSGYVNYIQYQYGTTKGDIGEGTRIADPFGFENNSAKNFEKYTSAQVVTEALTAGTGAQTLAWTPVAHGLDVHSDVAYDAHVVHTVGDPTYVYYKDADKKLYTDAAYTTQYTVVAGDKIAYYYDNVVIPQNSLPTVKAVMKSIPLLAKARRVAVYYSQIAAFQAKTDYGFDLGDALAERAVSELSYEIDTEVVGLLDSMAGTPDSELVWSKTLPVGVSKKEHYQGFNEILSIAKQKIYDATQKFVPNWMLIASNVLPVLEMMDAFKAASTGSINGPYLAGTIGSLKVYVSPKMAAGKYVVGVLGSDLQSAAAVYAPYMPIVPTQLLGFADGGMSQGWSTLYDLKPLNTNLVVAGEVTA